MSSAHAEFVPSSVLNNVNVLSISLKQLNTQFYLLLGVIALSIAFNSLTAMSHMGLFKESFLIPNFSGSTH